MVMFTINSVGNRLKANSKNYSFELFGYDFMVDSNKHLWLIEVNTNPSIEESGVLLKNLLPKMIDHLF
jgi:tubulin--tyrosine ligase